MKANIPPFTVGDKVVYITGIYMPKNSIHIITGIKQVSCGCWKVSILDVKFTSPNGLWICSYHNSSIFKDDGICICADSFRKVQEQTAPLLTFEKIKETEREQILIMN